MSEIKCPHCGKVFSVSESDYESIVSQVKNKEFDLELTKRIHEAKLTMEKDSLLNEEKIKSSKNEEISKLNRDIDDLKNQINNSNLDKEIAIKNANEAKDKEIALLKAQIHEKEVEITKLNNDIELNEVKSREKLNEELSKKNEEITKLNNTISINEKENQLKINSIKEENQAMLKLKQEELDHYKDLKAKLSTKLVGETLEQHCLNQFNSISLLSLVISTSFSWI